MVHANIPLDIKEKLLQVANILPKDKRGEFIKGVSTEIAGIVKDHPRTVIYAALGWVLGELIDNLLTVNIPFSDMVIVLTGDHASQIVGAGGAVLGFMDDRDAIKERRKVSRVIGEQLKKAAV